MADPKSPEAYRRSLAERQLRHEVDYLREAIIMRARSLAERLTRVADGLEADSDFNVNSIGELQGSGPELDTWCAKLGFARETLKLIRLATAEEVKD